MTKNLELMQAIGEIKFKHHLTQTLIAERIGISKQYLSDMVNGRYQTNNDFWGKIVDAFPDINFERYYRISENKPLRHDVTPVINNRRTGIPLVSQYAQAGYLSGYGDPEYLESLPLIDFTPDREMTGNWLAFEVRGDSMDDGTKHGYEQGEIVICREVEPYLYKDSRLHFNQRDFVIVHEEGILLKRVTDHDVEHHTIVIHSLNPIYPDRTLDLAQVRQIFSVVESRMQRKR